MLPLSDDRLARMLDRFALTVALLIAIGLPLGYFLTAYESLAEATEARAEHEMQAITDLVSASPDLWAYQVQRLEELLLRHPALHDDEAASVSDANDKIVVQVGVLQPAPVLRRSSLLYESDRVVGRVEIERSIRPLILATAWIAFLGVLLSGLAYAALRIFPLRALRRVTAELHQEKESWKFALEGAGEGVWDRNMQTGVVTYSNSYRDMYGFNEDELQRPENSWKKRTHPEDLPQVLAALQAYLEGKTALYIGERRMRCKDGRWNG